MGNNKEVPQKKKKIELPYDPAVSLLGMQTNDHYLEGIPAPPCSLQYYS